MSFTEEINGPPSWFTDEPFTPSPLGRGERIRRMLEQPTIPLSCGTAPASPKTEPMIPEKINSNYINKEGNNGADFRTTGKRVAPPPPIISQQGPPPTFLFNPRYISPSAKGLEVTKPIQKLTGKGKASGYIMFLRSVQKKKGDAERLTVNDLIRKYDADWKALTKQETEAWKERAKWSNDGGGSTPRGWERGPCQEGRGHGRGRGDWSGRYAQRN